MVTEIDNPIIAHKLAQLRNKNTSSKIFRELVKEISMLMIYEVGREFKSEEVTIETPSTSCRVKILHEENFVVVPILRAGLAMAEGVLKILHGASVGHIGLYRDEKTHKPVEYYRKMPPNLDEKVLLVTDPMLATGGSSSAALQMLRDKGAKKIIFMCIVAAPQGIEKVSTEHPDVSLYTASIDDGLNENYYIIPGLGDAGDRIFGTV